MGAIAARCLLAALAMGGAVYSRAQALPSPVSVSMTAEPNIGLHTGQPIDVTVTVKNDGYLEIDSLLLTSSTFVNELDILSNDAQECLVYATVVDAETPYYYLNWPIAIPFTTPPFAAGQQAVCHLQLALTAVAPQKMVFTFGVAGIYTDPGPNGSSSVDLVRAPVAPAVVPSNSAAFLVLLAFALIMFGLHRMLVGLQQNGFKVPFLDINNGVGGS